jgi:hypothetical protein
MANTTNFGWETPDDTDLVKDGAAAIRTLGSSIDTSFVDLKGGTTGQVLAKASNTDLDFTWSAADPLSILDAKGDLISATAADTPARLAVGANDTVLTADSTTATGLKWAAVSAGGMTELASGSLSGTSVTISSIPTTYRDLRLVIRDFVPSVDNDFLYGRVNGSSSAVYARPTTYTTTSVPYNDSEFYFTGQGMDNSVSNGLIIWDFFDYANTSTFKFGQGWYSVINATATTRLNMGGVSFAYGDTVAITSITMLILSGSMSGNYVLYGVK